ncbi:MAG TPA: Ig domain-containing protein [Steroidobacteraceae bacterium]|nr:Ig domain-containing protein [Steroidobacteraceae bacterium]
MLKKALPLLCAWLVVGCGGGDDDSPSPPPPPPAPSGLAYVAPPAFTVGTAIAPLSPTVTGTVVSYSVAPALPAGLAINTSNGIISGTPTARTPAANYVVTAGNSGGSTTATVSITVLDPPPIVGYPNTPYVLTVGTATTITPTSTGPTPTSWSVDRALPAGLAISAASGVISGTPTAIAAAANYVVTAASPAGNATTTLALTINAAAPVFSYFGSSFDFTTGVHVNLVPASTGGAVVNWSVSPALPAGLTLNGTTGAISGTPTQISPSANYVVSAQNTGGTTQFNIAMSVVAPASTNHVLLDLGHISGKIEILHDGARILSGGPKDTDVVLSDAQSGEILAHTKIRCSGRILCTTNPKGTALQGPVAVIKQPEGFDVRSSVDGTALALIAWEGVTDWWTLATDGSYIAGGNATGLTVWSPTGTILYARSGNFTTAKAFAAPGELRLAGGPAGASVVEYIALPAGTSTMSAAFQGTAHSWFLEGESFLTNSGNTIWVYSKAVVQREIAALPTITNLGGQGEWFWTHGEPPVALRLYRIGNGGTPAVTYPGAGAEVWPSKGAIGMMETQIGAPLSVIDLSGSTPVRNDYATPLPGIDGFGSASSSDWAFSNYRGAMLGELGGSSAPTRYTLGRTLSIAGSASRIAVATASGNILYLAADTLQPQGEVAFPSNNVQLSADGSVLAAAADDDFELEHTLKVFSLPSESLLAEWPYAYPNERLWDFTLSLSGDVIGRVTGAHQAPSTASVTLLDGTPLWTGTAGIGPDTRHLFLSPNGQLVALADGVLLATTSTNIYVGGTLTNSLQGFPLTWVDNDEILLNRWGPGGAFLGVDQRRVNGEYVIPLIQMPDLTRGQMVTPTSVYSANLNSVYNLLNGRLMWSSTAPHSNVGAVAGSNVVFASGATVRVEPL